MRATIGSTITVLTLLSPIVPGFPAHGGELVPRPAGPAPTEAEARVADSASFAFMLPYYEVDTTRSGVTTLWAVRNTSTSVLASMAVTYTDRSLTPVREEVVSISPGETLTVNLRDLGLPAEPDGFARGTVWFESSEPVLAADAFQVDPEENFATGDLLVSTDGDYLCDLWSTRFAVGGPFSGGTDLRLYVETPLGDDPQTDDPSVRFEVFDEQGNVLGTVDYWTATNVVEIPATDVVLEVSDTTAFGAFEVLLRAGTGGGIVTTEYRAEGRYSIGLGGTCID